MLPAAMSNVTDRKPGISDPLLIIVAALLLVAAIATLYFAANGPAKQLVKEPPARPRPIIEERVVVVTREVSGGGTSTGSAPEAHAKADAPKADAPKSPEVKAPEKAAEVTVAAPSVKVTSDGKIHGKVVLKGTPPPERPIAGPKSDAACGKSYPDKGPTTRSYVVGAEGGLRYAVVRIVNAPSGSGTPAEAPLIDQVGCMYEPYVVAAMSGQKFKIRNSDSFMHNVNSGAPKNNKGWNFSQVTAGQVNEKSFDNPEMWIKLVCNVHPWMTGYISIVDHAYFAVTDEKGAFSLPDGLAPGKYKLQVEHLKAGTASTEIEVAAGKGAEVTFELGVK
jgi:hypothetical protein